MKSASSFQEVKIGLEVHVQLNKLETKMFCGCSTDYHDAPPNSHTCPVCLALPGSLPVINQRAVEYALKVALALNCTIPGHTQFYRKNYYYPDLPKNFQISQYDYPLGVKGYLDIEGENGTSRVRITRVHMEEDPGRLVHEGAIDTSKYTLVDLNRSGMALLEVVTEPDLKSPKEARRFLDKLRNILEYLEVFDGDKEGAMRVDANISLAGGNRAEIKNISSHKGAEKALLYEIVRQRNLLRRGKKIAQETRHYDEAREITIALRTKEEAEDYRYFPEPDLPPLQVADWTSRIELPELPDAKKARFKKQYKIQEEHAKALTGELALANFYENVAKKTSPVLAATWICDILKGELNYRNQKIQAVKPSQIIELLELIAQDKITDEAAVKVIRTMLDHGGNPREIVKQQNLLKIEDDTIEKATTEAIAENPQAVKDYQQGKKEALNYLVGQVMKKTRGRSDPKKVREIILKKIEP